MFHQTPRDLYNNYHDAENDTAREYWYQCLKTRLHTGLDLEHTRYYLNRIDKAKQANTEADSQRRLIK